MKKAWSITTTVRNPYRLKDFLITLQELDGHRWDLENQKKYQIFLIQKRLYGYGSQQFCKGLSSQQINLINDLSMEISYGEAEDIFNTKNYTDPSMRGRQSMNPLKKYGFVSIENGNIHITSLGRFLLEEDVNLLEKIFFRIFIKWQIPNPLSNDYKFEDDYNIKPFIGVLHLINIINRKSIENGEQAKGINKQEFSLFCPTLINFKDIECYANKIIALREEQRSKSRSQQREIFREHQNRFIREFLNTTDQNMVDRFKKSLNDYGDNIIRYFRLTSFFNIRGGGYYIDLEQRRGIEIRKLLEFDNAEANIDISKDDYISYIGDISVPTLPWESRQEYQNIISALITDIQSYEHDLQVPPKEILKYTTLNEQELSEYIVVLRNYRRELQDEESHRHLQNVDGINDCIEKLKNIMDFDDRSILLEKLSFLGLNAINQALNIKANYPVGDDNEPTFTAPRNIPDIECYYSNFNVICEVTMLTNRSQWYNEGQPVMRHLRDFETQHNGLNYCIFIAPKLHRDTINTFWTSIKYEYEGVSQNIIPLSIGQFIDILKFQVELKENNIKLTDIVWKSMLQRIVDLRDSCEKSEEWIERIPNVIHNWKQDLL